MQKHRTLLAWQRCMDLVRLIYQATRSFPREELFGLTSQLRRASVSAAANIAEGYARFGSGEFCHSLSMALGSLAEIDTLLLVARDEGYLTQAAYEKLNEARAEASRVTLSLQRRYRK